MLISRSAIYPSPSQSKPEHQSLLGLEPVEGGREAEDAHEGLGRLFIAGRNRAPLLEPRPEPLDLVAIGVDPVRTGYRGLVPLRRDRWTRTQIPDVLAKGVTGMAPV